MLAEDTDEVLSFGTHASANGPFQPHASLNAQANGSLAVNAVGLNLLPSGGDTYIGSGKIHMIPHMRFVLCTHTDAWHNLKTGTMATLSMIHTKHWPWHTTHQVLHGCSFQSTGWHSAGDSEADLTVYGNVFVRPRSNSTNATTPAAQRRRLLQQTGTAESLPLHVLP